MSASQLTTMFAPPERAPGAEITTMVAQVAAVPLVARLLDSVHDGILILNRQRQIVLANQRALAMMQVSDVKPVLGLRPGEALHCAHAQTGPAGCGTSEFCRTCGAVKAILASQSGAPDVQECRVSRANGEALDLRVRATPCCFAELKLTIFAMLDISDEKRRKALERIFFHDILNTASGLRGLAELLQDADAEEAGQYKEVIFALARMIVEEINSQRTLTAAENNELTVAPGPVQAQELLQNLVTLYAHHDVAQGRRVRLAADTAAVELRTDRALLQRVVSNMIKNAVEASQPGEMVTAGCARLADAVEFWVHNPGEMPREVQLQVFQRSFSTKGAGRGLGTYGIKLLTERYLLGRAMFTTGPDGTVFRVRLPLMLDSAVQPYPPR